MLWIYEGLYNSILKHAIFFNGKTVMVDIEMQDDPRTIPNGISKEYMEIIDESEFFTLGEDDDNEVTFNKSYWIRYYHLQDEHNKTTHFRFCIPNMNNDIGVIHWSIADSLSNHISGYKVWQSLSPELQAKLVFYIDLFQF